MTGIADRTATPPPPRRASAFTLIEVLIVMFILALTASIVMSVAGYVMRSSSERETAGTQKLLLDAVQAYRDAGNPKVYPDPNDPNSYDPALSPYANGPSDSGRALTNILTGKLDMTNDGTSDVDVSQTPRAKAATEILLKLPQDAWEGNWNLPVKDAWGRPMRYEAKGGLGGRPVIVSAGPDGRFGTQDGPSIPDDLTKAEDNVRSDESQ